MRKIYNSDLTTIESNNFEISKTISKNLQNLPSFPFLSVSEYILQTFDMFKKIGKKDKVSKRIFFIEYNFLIVEYLEAKSESQFPFPNLPNPREI